MSTKKASRCFFLEASEENSFETYILQMPPVPSYAHERAIGFSPLVTSCWHVDLLCIEVPLFISYL